MRNYILVILIMAIGLCRAQSTKPSAANLEKLDEYMAKLDSKGFSGTILIAHGDSILHADGYGYRNLEQKKSNTVTTIFGTGSLTKQFTAAAILKLEMQGKLLVQDKISKYFSKVPAALSGIEIHHLLTHSAGFPVAIGSDYDKISEEEYITKAFASAKHIEPGSEHEYSNVGYALLSIIIEKVSGENYETFLRENLFNPAGMKNTGYLLPNWDEQNIAYGYSKKKVWGKPNEKPWDSDGPYLHLKGNGGILSTVEDLFAWHLALLGDEILSKEAKSKYYGKHIEEAPGDPSYYGYGWVIIPTGGETDLITHNGGNGVFFADFWRLLEEELTIILMSNKANDFTVDLAVNVARILLN
ncbi:serine hydrolase domain-containing protein [Flagellimonas myxillae]|uniref:serine hydrolase domain-containing protein n=1 Tax=Flagellimonas myxillae TaxID=2942214 RepID=UPI00201EEC52|nr:serine hydrolase domain-containing protein [Muricauda myxillae]MCL6265174.1 beta-lactamase family protein [Muricauda myxillae]